MRYIKSDLCPLAFTCMYEVLRFQLYYFADDMVSLRFDKCSGTYYK